MSFSLLEMNRQEKLLRVMEERGFTLSQQNGQRIYGGPPPNWGSRVPPSRESEIFIGRIPRLCFEDELIPLFASVGELYEFRLMLDFSGTNRGFAYAMFAEEETAYKAIRLLNHYEIRPGHYIGVLRCKNNCRLLFSNLKQDLDLNVFSEQIKSLTQDILKISIYENFEELRETEIGVTLEIDEAFEERITRYTPDSKFAVVEYETHKAAAVARRVLIPKLGHKFGIDWAIPPKDSNQFDQKMCARFEATLEIGYNFLRMRPVPLFCPPRSTLDGVLHIISTYRNIAKYFKFLINITLHKALRKGEIPLPVYMELERKIIERVKNIEHCSQATQLLLNYLTWYREKMMMFLDPESEKILIQVKYYAEKMLEIIKSKIALQRGHVYPLEDRTSNALPVTLSYCFYMAVFLGGSDRDKVCGLITDSIDWFSRLLQRSRDGNEEVSRFLAEISKLSLEMEEEKRRNDSFPSSGKMRKRKPEVVPTLQKTVGWNPFSGQSFPPFKKSAVTSTQQNPEFMDTDSSTRPREYPSAVGIFESRHTNDNIASNNALAENYQPCERTDEMSAIGNRPCGMEAESSVRHIEFLTDTSVFGVTGSNNENIAIGSCGFLYNISSPFPKIQLEFINDNETAETAHSLPSTAETDTTETRTFPDVRMEFYSGTVATVPALPSRPCSTNFSIMPRQFANICPFYKYIISVNLQKSVERCEITLHTYREIMMKIVDEIRHLEGCIEAINLIMDFLKSNKEGLVPISHDELFKVLDDIRTYACAIVGYVQTRGPSTSANSDLDNYYLRMVPNQMSFLYHLTLLLGNEYKEKLSGRLTESVKWLHELVQKSGAGDVQVVTFFEIVFKIGERVNIDARTLDIIRETCEEFNTIFNLSKISEN